MAYVLWGLFYVQFLMSFMFGWSLFGSSAAVSLEFHIKVEGYPWTLAELFLGVSVTMGIVSIVSAFVVSAKARAKWRLRLMVMLFAVFPVGFACIQYSSKDLNIESAEWQLERLEEEGEKNSESPGLLVWYDREIKYLREMLKKVDR